MPVADETPRSDSRLDPGSVLWTRFLERAKATVSSHVFETWLDPVRCDRFENGIAKLEVPDQFFRDWLDDHYVEFIREELAKIAAQPVAVDWVINPALRRTRPSTTQAHEAEPEKTSSPSTRSVSPDRYRRQLNRRYLFESFVCGPSNQFAVAASKAVADKPGASYNPLFLFGHTGLGKTHLLSAIGHHVLSADPSKHVIYCSAEQFTNEVVDAVLNNKLEDFRSKYRKNCDILLIDDIQIIAGKERTQHEFFHIFNTLYDSQRQIVVTSDKLPHEIPEIEERLRSRFQWGLIADIQPPEIETRVAILHKKAQDENVTLPQDVTFFLAGAIRSNVRELEGALVRVLAHASLTQAPITVDYAREVLQDVLAARPAKPSVENIQKTVASYYQVRIADLKSRRRQKTLVRPRQVAMYLARKHAGASFPDLGSRFGDKDHTTIMSACKKIDSLLKDDGHLRSQVTDIERRLDLSQR